MQLIQLLLELCDSRLQGGRPRFSLVEIRAADLSITVVHPGEESLKRVVVLLRNGIKLVIVAACTSHGQPEKSGRRADDDFVEFILPSQSFGFFILADLTRQ